jgi:micrococcal nuclease
MKRVISRRTKPMQIITILQLLIVLGVIVLLFFKPEILSNFVPSSGAASKITNTNPDLSKPSIVTHISDGDTIKLADGRTIRYLNIDTPETVKPNTPVMCGGPEAKALNVKLVEGQNVTIVYDKEQKDRYSRDLGFVFLPGSDTREVRNSVNAIMVKEGWARTVVYKPNDTFAPIFYELEREAQKANKGLWAICKKPFVE